MTDDNDGPWCIKPHADCLAPKQWYYWYYCMNKFAVKIGAICPNAGKLACFHFCPSAKKISIRARAFTWAYVKIVIFAKPCCGHNKSFWTLSLEAFVKYSYSMSNWQSKENSKVWAICCRCCGLALHPQKPLEMVLIIQVSVLRPLAYFCCAEVALGLMRRLVNEDL